MIILGEYTFEKNKNNNYRTDVLHIPSGVVIPYSALSGGGSIFDRWHNMPLDEQSKLLFQWKKEQKEMLNKINAPLDCCDAPNCLTPTISPSKVKYPWVGICQNQESTSQTRNKEQTMRIETIAVASQASKSDIRIQRDHLNSRLSGMYYPKVSELSKAFHLYEDEPPKTIKERKQRIADGKYIITFTIPDDNYDEEDTIYGLGRGYIVWRDPKTPADKAGYDVALTAMNKAKTDAQDIIEIMDEKEGLKAVQAFEAMTFH